MKKTLILLIAAVFLMMPSVSFAKETMTDNELSTISGEAGVTITFNSFFLSLNGNTSTQRTPFIQRFFYLVHNTFHRNTITQTNNTSNNTGSNTSSGNSLSGYSFMNGIFATFSGGLIINAH